MFKRNMIWTRRHSFCLKDRVISFYFHGFCRRLRHFFCHKLFLFLIVRVSFNYISQVALLPQKLIITALIFTTINRLCLTCSKVSKFYLINSFVIFRGISDFHRRLPCYKIAFEGANLVFMFTNQRCWHILLTCKKIIFF